MRDKQIAENENIWTRPFINIFIVNFVMSMGQFMMNTLIPKYAYSLGSVATVVGMVTSVFAITALGLRPFTGPAIDYFKKTNLLKIAIGLITIAFVFYSFSTNITMLVIARLIHGIGVGFTAPLTLAMASNTLPYNKIASGLGMFSLGGAVATAIGPTLGLKLSSIIGYNKTFLICAGFMALGLLLSFFLKGEEPDRTARFNISLKQIFTPEAFIPTIVIFFQVLAFSSINSFIAIYGDLCDVEEVGLFFTANAISMIFIRPFSGKIADKLGMDKTILPGLIIFIAALLCISFSRSLPMFIISGIIAAVGFGSSEPVLQALNLQLVPKERRGAASNTNFIGIDVGFLLGPTIAGSIITALNKSTGSELTAMSTMYRIMIIPAAIAVVIFFIKGKKLMAKVKEMQKAQ
jgi:MFS family permease